MASVSGFELTPDLLVQGIIGALIALWALKDAIPIYRNMKKAAHPDPMLAAVSMAWDRDMQERMLQILERMATASELQAKQQIEMAGSWGTMVDQRQQDMNEKIDDLMQALARKEDQLSAMIVRTQPRRRL